MATYTLSPELTQLRGKFSPDFEPQLRIQSGDTVVFKTLDAGWFAFEPETPFVIPPKLTDNSQELQQGHAMSGPIYVEGARAGMVLELRFNEIVPATWGWCRAGGFAQWNQRYGLDAETDLRQYWQIDVAAGVARTQTGFEVSLSPFMGNVGMPPAESGWHSTAPPRKWGGNIDCKALVVGSRLFLPVPVDGGLVMVGDGHAAQGDGEVSGTAIECSMERVSIEFHLHDDMELAMPRAYTPSGWLTFGFSEDLDEAQQQALYHMLDFIVEAYDVPRVEAVVLASVAVDLHITQVVNGVKGVHAILPHDAIRRASTDA